MEVLDSACRLIEETHITYYIIEMGGRYGVLAVIFFMETEETHNFTREFDTYADAKASISEVIDVVEGIINNAQ